MLRRLESLVPLAKDLAEAVFTSAPEVKPGSMGRGPVVAAWQEAIDGSMKTLTALEGLQDRLRQKLGISHPASAGEQSAGPDHEIDEGTHAAQDTISGEASSPS
jgi:hypothetical protein